MPSNTKRRGDRARQPNSRKARKARKQAENIQQELDRSDVSAQEGNSNSFQQELNRSDVNTQEENSISDTQDRVSVDKNAQEAPLPQPEEGADPEEYHLTPAEHINATQASSQYKACIPMYVLLRIHGNDFTNYAAAVRQFVGTPGWPETPYTTMTLFRPPFTTGELRLELFYHFRGDGDRLGDITIPFTAFTEGLVSRVFSLPQEPTTNDAYNVPLKMQGLLSHVIHAQSFVQLVAEVPLGQIHVSLNDNVIRRLRRQLGNGIRTAVQPLKDIRDLISSSHPDNKIKLEAILKDTANVRDALAAMQRDVDLDISSDPCLELFPRSRTRQLVDKRILDDLNKLHVYRESEQTKKYFWSDGSRTAIQAIGTVAEHKYKVWMCKQAGLNEIQFIAIPVPGPARYGVPAQYFFVITDSSELKYLPRIGDNCKIQVNCSYKCKPYPDNLHSEAEIASIVSRIIVQKFRMCYQKLKDATATFGYMMDIFSIVHKGLSSGKLSVEQENAILDQLCSTLSRREDPRPKAGRGSLIDMNREDMTHWSDRVHAFILEHVQDYKIPNWKPSLEGQLHWDVERIEVPECLSQLGEVAFLANTPMQPYWPKDEKDAADLSAPRPLLQPMFPYVLANSSMMQVIANALKTKTVKGKILMDEDDINLKAQLAAINGMATDFQNPNSSASFSTFINTFQGHHDIHILSEILPTVKTIHIVSNLHPPMALPDGLKITKFTKNLITLFGKLDDDQRNVFKSAERLPYGMLIIHGAPGSGKSAVVLAIVMCGLAGGISSKGIIPFKASTVEPWEVDDPDVDKAVQAIDVTPPAPQDQQPPPQPTDPAMDTWCHGNPDLAEKPNWNNSKNDPEKAVGLAWGEEAAADDTPVKMRAVIQVGENVQGNDLTRRYKSMYQALNKGKDLSIVRINTLKREKGHISFLFGPRRPDDSSLSLIDQFSQDVKSHKLFEAADLHNRSKRTYRIHSPNDTPSGILYAELQAVEAALRLPEADRPPVNPDLELLLKLLRLQSTKPDVWAESKERANSLVTQQFERILLEAQVVIGTSTAIYTYKGKFPDWCSTINTVVIEEAGRMPEPETYIPFWVFPNAKLRILSGDHKQSPPLVFSKDAFSRHFKPLKKISQVHVDEEDSDDLQEHDAPQDQDQAHDWNAAQAPAQWGDAQDQDQAHDWNAAQAPAQWGDAQDQDQAHDWNAAQAPAQWDDGQDQDNDTAANQEPAVENAAVNQEQDDAAVPDADGDDDSLPPMNPQGFQRSMSMMERAYRCGFSGITELMVNHRSLSGGHSFASTNFYGGAMHAPDYEPSDGDNLSSLIIKEFSTAEAIGGIAMLDIKSKAEKARGTSQTNELHAKAGAEVCRIISKIGIRAKASGDETTWQRPTILVLTPYLAQKPLIKTELARIPKSEVCHDLIDVRTVNSSMGHDADYVVVQMVRDGDFVGFTSNPQILNVATTQARYGTIIIFSSHALGQGLRKDRFLKKLVIHCMRRQAYRQEHARKYETVCTKCGKAHGKLGSTGNCIAVACIHCDVLHLPGHCKVIMTSGPFTSKEITTRRALLKAEPSAARPELVEVVQPDFARGVKTYKQELADGTAVLTDSRKALAERIAMRQKVAHEEVRKTAITERKERAKEGNQEEDPEEMAQVVGFDIKDNLSSDDDEDDDEDEPDFEAMDRFT
ncbi:hypothetical protein MCOR21_003382 [Pyricularia oryzae]|uniref:DNA2/NAM7 helicase-like C-terminal domain-containing protein n=1 Tax=Pyricularia grisea TaxID=148305 RepID=A0ABQ8NUF9_PYRGI|nr:hypothetical protein MCOR01_006755 [Pyricularia oryzae]KAI6302325.1 hypothetical protein MCOR33_002354 [Pyricularia grisea]KAI6430950.1 hypothetical protein MCOR24_001755 [Pyricularia oryzae]KAI6432501.1 hypothetical protein MCOR21_003382 [Pyricularia oryzae]